MSKQVVILSGAKDFSIEIRTTHREIVMIYESIVRSLTSFGGEICYEDLWTGTSSTGRVACLRTPSVALPISK